MFAGKYMYIDVAVIQNMFEVKKSSSKRKISFVSTITGFEPARLQKNEQTCCIFPVQN